MRKTLQGAACRAVAALVLAAAQTPRFGVTEEPQAMSLRLAALDKPLVQRKQRAGCSG